MLVDKCLFVEVKAVDKIHALHESRLLSYMKVLDDPLGLIFMECKSAHLCGTVSPQGEESVVAITEKCREKPAVY